MADYMTSKGGSEDLVTTRRAAFMDSRSKKDESNSREGLDKLIEDGRGPWIFHEEQVRTWR
jgi:hypothetical protein